MKSIQKLPCAPWRDVAELFGKLTDRGITEDYKADPQAQG